MTTKTWIGGDGQFSNAAAWTPTGAPGDGDTAIINDSTVQASGALPRAFALRVNSSAAASPTLIGTDLVVLAGSSIDVVATQTTPTLKLAGAARNDGRISLSGSGPGSPVLTLIDPASGPATRFVNNGGINLVDTNAILASNSATAELVNNGTIAMRSTSATAYAQGTLSAISGTGTIRVGVNETWQPSGNVGAGQTVVLEAGAGGRSILSLSYLGNFAAKVSGLGAADEIDATTLRWDTYTYTGDTTGGRLSLLNAGSVVNTLDFVGAYTQSDFNVTRSPGGSAFTNTVIKTTKADAAQTISFTDIVTGVVGSDAASNYADPNVPYLQKSYFWGYDTPVAIRADVGNVFLKGGAGGDALQVTGGSNVIDGGGGSNYLIGATGTDGGSDVFFVDGRGNTETWSTILNFHKGDLAVIFGFKQATSTQNWIDSDGAPGATGYTLHSELAGVGTGTTGSMTFTGIDRATANASFEITYGSQAAQGNDYILIRYT